MFVEAKHGKNHPVSELAMRQAIWCATDAKIAKHNEEHAQGLQSYAMDHNQFSDLVSPRLMRRSKFNDKDAN